MIELSPFLQLCEWVIKLLDGRQKRDQAYFETVVKPTFEASRRVRDDFIDAFTQLEAALARGAPRKDVATFLDFRRGRHLGDRDQLRGLLTALSKDQFSEFEIGVVKIVGGHLPHELQNLRYKIQSSLDANDHEYRRKGLKIDPLPLSEATRAEVTQDVARAKLEIEQTWMQITSGYAEYVRKYSQLPKSAA